MAIPIIDVTEVSEWDQLQHIKYNTTIDDDTKYRTYVCQNIVAFDIETSNGFRQPDGTIIGFDHDKYEENNDTYDLSEPQSLMYIWQFGIETQDGPKVFVGRTWESFNVFLTTLTDEISRSAYYPNDPSINSKYTSYEYSLTKGKKPTVRLYIYIHNLAFEYQHLRNVFEDELSYNRVTKRGIRSATFARSQRKPMKAAFKFNNVKIEFRDTLVLVQKSLDAWCKDEKLPVKKLEMSKDYYLKPRTPLTELEPIDYQYSINDVVSMVYGIEKYRDKYNTLQNIPLTQTGGVRRICVDRITKVNPEWAKACTDITKGYTIDLFKLFNDLFSGGWTHANAQYTGLLVKYVRCWDFASSYPAVMSVRTFPTGEFIKCELSEYDYLTSQNLHSPDLDYHYFINVKVNNIKSKLDNTFWSISKCGEAENPRMDNGKVYEADSITVSLTDLDWDIFQKAYSFSDFEVIELWKSKASYLPVELITTILGFYADKTSLKGTGNESKYVESKQFTNSIYGVAVTKLITDTVIFDHGWSKTPLDDETFYSEIAMTDEDKTFLSYQIGIWVTAWARHNLWDAILQFDTKTVYCDTDSIKGLFTDEDMKWFELYNVDIANMQNEVARRLDIDPELYNPTTIKGEHKRLGVFDQEDDCIEFRTLGAKRYCYESLNKNNEPEIHTTIAGLPKAAGVAKIKHVSDFNSGMVWSTRESMKLNRYYNDNQTQGTWVDHNGDTYTPENYPQFGTCLRPTTFDMSLSDEYEALINYIGTGERDIDMMNEVSEFFNN